AAGIGGLNIGPTYGMKPLVAGLLLAIAGGQLALALARVVVFAAAGLTTAAAVHAGAPANWDIPLGWFLAGGLVGLLLFRLWTMLLTSFLGALLMGYSLLCLLDHLHKLSALDGGSRLNFERHHATLPPPVARPPAGSRHVRAAARGGPGKHALQRQSRPEAVQHR